MVIISGHGNIEIAVAAIKQGAYDFIEKPFNIDQLMVVIRRAMETSRLRRENSALRRQDQSESAMIGQSAAFRALGSQLDKVTKSNGRIMLTGGAGVGKEMAARYIHAHSGRADGPFVTVNSASIAPDHMEEVLFGRDTPERGVEQGLLEQAHGGIIYFDEVADMPLGTQGKILRVLVDQSFHARRWNRQCAGGFAGHFLDNPRSDRRDCNRALPRRTVPPAERCAHRGACAGGAARGYPASCAPLHRRLQPRSGLAPTRAL